MTTHLYSRSTKYTTAFIQAQLSINQKFKTGLPMSVSLRVHGEKINKTAQQVQVDGILIQNLLFGDNYKYTTMC